MEGLTETGKPPAGRPTDRFGNPIERSVGYARGEIISDDIAEAARQRHAYNILRDRYSKFGDAEIFNLTGLIRGFPFADGDEDALRSYVHYIPRSRDRLEQAALARLGGNETHDGFLAARVSSAMLAVMLALLRPGERVLSLVPADRSHPSIIRAVDIVGGEFREEIGIDAYETAIGEYRPSMVVITTICPSKHHLPLTDTTRAIELARRIGALVILDDAHMAARISLYDEPPALGLGVDVALWSLDKHLRGPRSGFVSGNRDLIKKVRARALALGLEAQLGQCLAGLRAIERFDPEPIRVASRLAEKVLTAIQPEMEGKGYLAGAGLALSGEDMLEIAIRRSNSKDHRLVPIEAVAFAAITILEKHGAVSIPAIGMPGAACTFRLMMYPDGERLGEAGLTQCWRTAIDALTGVLDRPDEVRTTLFGKEAT
jgi:L-seryl-tRNA(Ser) seleniumtransferase